MQDSSNYCLIAKDAPKINSASASKDLAVYWRFTSLLDISGDEKYDLQPANILHTLAERLRKARYDDYVSTGRPG
jgi:hypothetical protein